MKAKASLYLLLGLALLMLSGQRHSRLLELRSEFQLNEAPPLENTTPMVAFTTVALGSFRGIIVDILWVRASRLQDEGRYFELVQLADWITKLEPRVPEVWAFHAWNLSYNVSVLFNKGEDRWRWVNQGIKLLRDEALVHNPANPTLHWELSWIYFQKLGMTLDSKHPYYIQQLAAEMEPVFTNGRFNPNILEDENRGPLFKQTRLDAELIQEIEHKYGPFDWRLPYSHAAYWAYAGLPKQTGFSALRLHRQLYQTFSEEAKYGRLFNYNGKLIRAPQPQAVDRATLAYIEAMAKFPKEHTIPNAYRSFTAQMVIDLTLSNLDDRAAYMYQLLKKTFPDESNQENINDFLFYIITEKLHQAPPEQLIDLYEEKAALFEKLGAHDLALGHKKIAALLGKQSLPHINTLNKLQPNAPE